MQALNWSTLSRAARTAGEAPHVVVDDALDAAWVRANALDDAVRAAAAGELARFRSYNTHSASTEGAAALPAPVRALIDEMHGPAFLRWLSDVTGIADLRADVALCNGGLHFMGPGGYLRLHRDELIHPELPRWRRRLNVMVYLNPRWEPGFGGHLEIWSHDGRRPVARLEPAPYRCVVTLIEQNVHGIPAPVRCPEGEARTALVLWFYTEEPAPVPFIPAEFVPHPDDGAARRALIALESGAFGAYHRLRRRFDAGARAARALMDVLGYGRSKRRAP